MSRQAFRGEILHFSDDPARVGDESYDYIEDGVLVVEDGLVDQVGGAETVLATLSSEVPVTRFPNSLIMPGFVDSHVHYPQLEMIASPGEQLLGWLEAHAFPAEARYGDVEHARSMADFFLEELLANGTTTAMVFGTVHRQSVDAFFECARAKRLRMICGKVLMDRNAPAELLDTAASGYADSRDLIERWHGKGRLQYAVTPRFAPTCSDEQLNGAARLLQEFPDVYLHTHLSENQDELAWVDALYPDAPHYVGVYDSFGLVRRRSVFAHGVHLKEAECEVLAAKQGGVAHCPTSNLFLGSGLFDLAQAERHGFPVGLGTDVGGGTSLSMLQTLNEAYKVQQLRGETLTALKAFYLATLGGARVLDLDDRIGNFTRGKEADFVVLDYGATPLLSFRQQRCRDIEEKLFVLAMLGDDRAVAQTYILGTRHGPRNGTRV